MIQMISRTKRQMAYLLAYMMLISMIQPFALKHVSAANSKKLYGAGMSFLQPANISTEAGIVVTGAGTVAINGAAYELLSEMPDIGETASGSSVVATGAAVNLRYGISTAFTIGEYGAPAMFSIVNGGQSGICHQFRVVSSASEGFYAWLVDGLTNELLYRVDGLGGQNIWRLALEQHHTYYLLLTGEAGSSGKLLLSDIMDDHGNSFNQATSVALNREQSIETEIGGDVDILAFNAVAAVSSYRIQIDPVLGNGGSYTLYDHNGKAVSACSGTVGTSRVTKAFSATPGARYYFHFSSAQAGRRIVVRILQATTNYQIIYHLNGGQNAKENIRSYTSTLSRYALKNATRSKYIFGGWHIDPGCTKRIYNVYGANRRNFHLYAKWIKVSPQKSSISFLKSKKVKQVKVKWKKQAGVKGYQIMYGTTRSLKKAVKKKTLTKTYLTLNKMKPGTVYYFKLRSYSLDSKGKRIYSGYSKVKKVKVKAKKMKTKKKTKKKKAVKK